MDQLGERSKREALGAFLKDKEVYVKEAKTRSLLQSRVEDLAHQFPKDPSDLVEPFSVEDDGNDGHNRGGPENLCRSCGN